MTVPPRPTIAVGDPAPFRTAGDAGGGAAPDGAGGQTPDGLPAAPPPLRLGQAAARAWGPAVRPLITAEDIQRRLAEMGAQISADYAGREVLLVAVLKGAVMVMADLSRGLSVPATLEFMAISSYGQSASSSGVVRILKDLDRDISGQHVLIVEDIIDSGLTLSWLVRNLSARGPASLQIAALLRKPQAAQAEVAAGLGVRYVGFDIGPEFVVGYGLDYAERYRTLPYVGLLET